MTYADQVRRARNALDYSQEALAIAAGVSKRTIQNVEAGGSPGPETRRALAAVLGSSMISLAPSSIPVEGSRSTAPCTIHPAAPIGLPCGDDVAVPRRWIRSPGNLFAPDDEQEAGLIDFIVLVVAIALSLAGMSEARRYLFEPNLWVTVERRVDDGPAMPGTDGLSNAISPRYPQVRHVELLTSSDSATTTRRVYGMVAHGVDPSELSAYLLRQGLAASVSTMDPDPQ